MRMRTKLLARAVLVALPWATPCLAERLRDEVKVETDTVWLSDLLSQDAGLRLRSAAEKIALGRAPEPGSVRIFSAFELKQAAAGWPQIEVPEKVTVRRDGWSIEIASIREALGRRSVAARFDLSRAEILPPPEFRSRTARPDLDVAAIRKEPGGGHLLVTMRCRDRRECGTFLVKTSLPKGTRVSAGALAETNPLPGEQRTSNVNGDAFAVEPNHTAIVKIEESGLLITEPVTPLRRARRGEIVQVRSGFGRQVLRAEVIGPGLLTPADPGSQAGNR